MTDLKTLELDNEPKGGNEGGNVIGEWSFFVMDNVIDIAGIPYSMIVFCHQNEVDGTEPRQDYVNELLRTFLENNNNLGLDVLDYPAGDNSIMIPQASSQQISNDLVSLGIGIVPELAQTLFGLP